MNPIIPNLIGFAAVITATLVTQRSISKRLSKIEHLKYVSVLNNDRLNAYKKFWSIFIYTTKNSFVKEKIINNEGDNSYIDTQIVRKFFVEANSFFYSEEGLFLSERLRKAFIKMRDDFDEKLKNNIDNESICISHKEERKIRRYIGWLSHIIKEDISLYDIDFPEKKSTNH